MARTLYLNDGSTEVVIGDQEEVLGRIIEERLGRDCKELFDDIKKRNGLRNLGTQTAKKIMRELLMGIIRCCKTLWKIWTRL